MATKDFYAQNNLVVECNCPKCKKQLILFFNPIDIVCSCKNQIKDENIIKYNISETEYDKMKLKEFKANEKIRIAKEKEKSKKKLNKAKK